ncbi:MAG: sensor histidine kinase [Alphaproteobacteria bacterium]|nr:sensor histidine kinase [Alphaproteobacteria bacterium]
MAQDAEKSNVKPTRSTLKSVLFGFSKREFRKFRFFGFGSIYGRIIVMNVVALAILLSGILYLDQTKEGLIDAKLESLITQSVVIAGALSASASEDDFGEFDFSIDELLEDNVDIDISQDDVYSTISVPIDPEDAAQILRHSLLKKKTRARIFDAEGVLLLDSRSLYAGGDILQSVLAPLGETNNAWYEELWNWVKLGYLRRDLALYKEYSGENGRKYSEVATALNGEAGTNVRVDENGNLVLSVAVPIQKLRSVLGILFLSTKGSDIEAMVATEQVNLFKLFAIAAVVIIVLSFFLAQTIALPIRSLANAAEEVGKDIANADLIPDYSNRRDEIGHLSGSLGKMTEALFSRIEAIERFAADVSHELKNPLTSLRSAVETLPIAKSDENKKVLMEIILQDVQRLDRLITDISDASRLDAELAREEKEEVDLKALLETLVLIANETKRNGEAQILLDVAEPTGALYEGDAPFLIAGHNIRLGQVVQNIIGNARSFAPKNSKIDVIMRRMGGHIYIDILDEGAGIQAEDFERIFERFYTDRQHMMDVDPDEYIKQDFGDNSGLGLSICKQIIEAHQGTISAENIVVNNRILGAKFSIKLPVGSVAKAN